MKKSTFNRLLSIFLMVMAVIFGVNGNVVMAEAALPNGGTTESGHAAEAGPVLFTVSSLTVVLIGRVPILQYSTTNELAGLVVA